MKITLRDPELELEVNKVDTPTGASWCVIMPDERKVLVKLHHGQWKSEDRLNQLFVQSIGQEITRFLDAERAAQSVNKYPESNPRPKRESILKYLL